MRRSAVLGVCVALALSATAAGAARVEVRDDVFSRTSLTIAKGATVKWVWVGSDKHNVITKSGPAAFRSPLQRKGVYKRKFGKRGTYELLCSVHAPDMAMTVTVR